jgi:Glycosyl hydrolases family 16/Calx-beta domain
MRRIFVWIVSASLLTACDKKSSKDADQVNPAVSITDVAIAEGNTETTNFVFSVTLDRVTSKTVTLTYSTQDGTATSGSDYTAITNQTLTFQPNETAKQITVAVKGEKVRENDEKFTIVISSASNATIVKSTATGTIQNDDAVGEFSNLVWADEFNGTSLNLDNWTYETGDGCPNLCGWGNNELEYYTNRPENLFFRDGNMVIKALKENFNGKNYTSAKIVSRGKKAFKFGRMEIRAKLPKGKGIWPAIWMLPQNNVYGAWPRSGELDIMELVGHEPNKAHGTVHYGPGPGSIQFNRSYTLTNTDFSADFHVFSITWDANIIQWYVDGNLFGTFTNTDAGSATYPFNEDFYFIMNLAVGGNWPGSPDATTTFPQELVVDYVRVYQ